MKQIPMTKLRMKLIKELLDNPCTTAELRKKNLMPDKELNDVLSVLQENNYIIDLDEATTDPPHKKAVTGIGQTAYNHEKMLLNTYKIAKFTAVTAVCSLLTALLSLEISFLSFLFR